MKIDRLYKLADIVGNSKSILTRRLNDARQDLNDKYKPMFSKKTIDFENKCMMSDDGSMRLQWTNDGTTSVGTVKCIYNKQPNQ